MFTAFPCGICQWSYGPSPGVAQAHALGLPWNKRALPRRRIDGQQRFHFSISSDPDGPLERCRQPRPQSSRRRGHRYEFAVCSCVPCGILNNLGNRFPSVWPPWPPSVEKLHSEHSGAPSPFVSNVANRGCVAIFFVVSYGAASVCSNPAPPANCESFRQ